MEKLVISLEIVGPQPDSTKMEVIGLLAAAIIEVNGEMTEPIGHFFHREVRQLLKGTIEIPLLEEVPIKIEEIE